MWKRNESTGHQGVVLQGVVWRKWHKLSGEHITGRIWDTCCWESVLVGHTEENRDKPQDSTTHYWELVFINIIRITMHCRKSVDTSIWWNFRFVILTEETLYLWIRDRIIEKLWTLTFGKVPGLPFLLKEKKGNSLKTRTPYRETVIVNIWRNIKFAILSVETAANLWRMCYRKTGL
jgi:hypothetical protein